MALDSKAQAILAMHRFGFGPAFASRLDISSDPRGALLAELDRPGAGQVPANGLRTSAEGARALAQVRLDRKERRQREAQAKKDSEARMAQGGGMASDAGAADAAAKRDANQGPPVRREVLHGEAETRIDAAVGAGIGFAERLVWFWSNHFCVSENKARATAGAYEREAIRPHVLGRFGNMLLAVESHPAMLTYLDNFRSIGPNSVAGINRNRGLNENLAREILELHTLGVRTGYRQEDVTNFAKVLTGWTQVNPRDPARGGEFVFMPRLHEPGPQTVLGKVYQDTGVDQGRAVLADIARHPATATHIARKLAVHFVSDDPPPLLVEKLATTFKRTDGNLKEVSRTLVMSDEAWTPERRKLKRPSEWIISVLRISGITTEANRVIAGQTSLGEPLWKPPAPNGFAEAESSWLDGLPRRLDFADSLASQLGETTEPRGLMETGLGPLASAETRQAIGRAESRKQALTLLFMAPEFVPEMTMTLHAPTRRQFLLSSGALFAWANLPKVARAEGRDPRFLAIVLRGALDGLAAVPPVGDPNWVSLRGDHALRLDGPIPALRLDGFFALHPAMPNLHRLYGAGQAIIVHASATPYRDRSHFDGQDVLESGQSKPGGLYTGWLNRALAGLAPEGRADPGGSRAFAVGPVTPLVVRGPAPILSWAPRRIQQASDDTLMRLLDLYNHTDGALARAIEGRVGLAGLAGAGDMNQAGGRNAGGGLAQVRAFFAESAGTAAKYLSQPGGPRVGALALDGWDTHINEGIANGRLAQLLGALDGALGAAESNMGAAWNETVIAVITEFGRTARVNGNEGTDHGSGTVAILAGGALKGGRVLANWPGLREADLYEGRDLKPTTDLRAVLKGLLRDHLRVREAALDNEVFPGSAAARPIDGLVRS